MSWKNLLSFAVVSALLASAAVAQPTASLSGVENGGNFDWTLSFAADAGLFTDPPNDNPDQGLGGSLATAFQIELAAGGLVSVGSPTADFTGGVNPILDANPAIDPYAAGITEGVESYNGVACQIAGCTGNVDAIFAPLAGTFFTDGNDNAALTFTTSVNEVTAGGIVAQAGNEYTIDPFTETVDTGFPLGDFTGDGQVDGADLSLLLGNWGNTVPPLPMGNNGTPFTDTLVDGDDLSNLLGTWGVGVPAAGAAVIPEPATVLSSLIGFCGLGLALRRRNK